MADFELMFNNARHYNEESSQVYKDACTLEKTLMSKVQSLPAIDGGPSGASKRQPGSAMSLNSKLTEMYNAIRDFKDAKLRVLSTPFMKLPLKSVRLSFVMKNNTRNFPFVIPFLWHLI